MTRRLPFYYFILFAMAADCIDSWTGLGTPTGFMTVWCLWLVADTAATIWDFHSGKPLS